MLRTVDAGLSVAKTPTENAIAVAAHHDRTLPCREFATATALPACVPRQPQRFADHRLRVCLQHSEKHASLYLNSFML